MKHLLVTFLALVLGFFVGMGSSNLFADTPIAPLLPGNNHKTSSAADEPVVVFSGNSFTENQKESITKNFVQPYTIYNQLTDSPLATVMISNSGNGQIGVDYIHRNGSYGGFTHEHTTMWYPTCMGQCPLPEDFTKLYPKIADKIRGL